MPQWMGMTSFTPSGGPSGRLLAANGLDPIDRAVERGDNSDPGRLRAGDQVRVREVESIDVVYLDRPLQEPAVDDANWRETQDRAKDPGDVGARDLVEGLESVRDLREDQVRQQQVPCPFQVPRGASGEVRGSPVRCRTRMLLSTKAVTAVSRPASGAPGGAPPSTAWTASPPAH